MQYWLIKSEPDVYSIADLERDGTTLWDGVRNYQARNFLRTMAVGDRAFFYHSNAAPPGIVGLSEVCETHLVDPSQFDPASDYYDPKSAPDQPRWQTVRIRFVQQFQPGLSLAQLKDAFTPEELGVVRRGNRLSVLPVPGAIALRLLQLLGAIAD